MRFTSDPRLSDFNCPVYGFRKLDKPDVEKELWDFLCSAEIVALMEEGSINGEPVIDRISKIMVKHFGLEEVNKNNFRQLTGKMIRPIMKKIKFYYTGRGPTKNGIFATSAKYSPIFNNN